MEDVPESRSQFDNLEKLIRRPRDTRLKEPQKLIRRPPEARLKECRPCTHPDPSQQPCPWTTAIKLLTKSSQVGTHSFWGTSPLCPPLPDKAISLFFSISPRTLALRFNTAPVHRSPVFNISTRYFVKLSWLNHHWLLNNVSNIWRKDFKEMIRLLNHCFQIIICQPSCGLKPKSALSLQIVLPTFLKLNHFLSGWRKWICWVFWHYCVFAMGIYCTYL